jgi:hypothetical protein
MRNVGHSYSYGNPVRGEPESKVGKLSGAIWRGSTTALTGLVLDAHGLSN